MKIETPKTITTLPELVVKGETVAIFDWCKIRGGTHSIYLLRHYGPKGIQEKMEIHKLCPGVRNKMKFIETAFESFGTPTILFISDPELTQKETFSTFCQLNNISIHSESPYQVAFKGKLEMQLTKYSDYFLKGHQRYDEALKQAKRKKEVK